MSIPVETEEMQNDTLEFKAKQLLGPTTLPTERYELKHLSTIDCKERSRRTY